MKIQLIAPLAVLCTIGLLSPRPSYAESSKEYAAMGKATYSAFVCSTLAELAEKTDEQERLFKHGYEVGKKFIEAAQANKIARTDLSNSVPTIVLMLLEGPNADFMLGRIYSDAVERAFKEVSDTNGKTNSEEIRKSLASDKFWKQNCSLIGN